MAGIYEKIYDPKTLGPSPGISEYNSSTIEDIGTCLCSLDSCDYTNIYDMLGDVPYDVAYNILDSIIREFNFTCPVIYQIPSAIETPTKYGLTILFFLTVALSIVGNVVVICVLTFGARKKRDFNIFLLNLAVADWTLAIFSMPFSFINAMQGEWIFGGCVMCSVTAFIKKVSEAVSIFTLTAIGIDRYYAVMYPLRNRMSSSRPRIVIGGIWAISTCLSVVKPIVSYTKTYPLDMYSNNTVTICKEWWPNDTLQIVYELTLFVATYVAPLTVLSFTYTKVAMKLWTRSIPGNADQGRDASHNRSKKKTIKMLVSIVVLFALCWMPLNLFYLITLFNDNTVHEYSQQKATTTAYLCVLIWIAVTDSFINPIIYVFLNDGFRGDMKRFFRRVCKFSLGTDRKCDPRTGMQSMSSRSTFSRSTRQRTNQELCSLKTLSPSLNTLHSLKVNENGFCNGIYDYRSASASRSTSCTSETLKM
ncbi:substance-K receptor-like [Saccoglossus kowalevskii]|uniref:Substance-P receptor-like n=1 Tax=Saccoglossus kowalevskii TaxID=10224 RepID=A0ABM0GJW9_SACKO|nr:PREDICTED: substance-P receptor-like [Saccoglossus kowalevskii]